MNEVQWTPRAIRQLRKIKDRETQTRIRKATRKLAEFPDVQGVKPLTGHAFGYRLRVGCY
jgi:mRNA-degrading endonuclease RelE of RelBE toxin-antitoxin system